MRLLEIVLLLALVGMPCLAQAGMSQAAIAQIEAAPRPGAALPADLRLQDETGQTKPLHEWLAGLPSLWILADYTCQTLCGPVISIAAGALARSGLKPGTDFQLIVAGFDPKDTAGDARAMKRAQIGDDRPLAAATHFLRGDARAVAELTAAFGFRTSYDRDHDQFAHPAAAFAVTPDGHVTRALSGLALDAGSLRLALVDAGRGKIGSFTDHVRALCYGFDPAAGVYTVLVGRILTATGIVTMAALLFLIGLLSRRERAAPSG
jgi:protein SCO1/2